MSEQYPQKPNLICLSNKNGMQVHLMDWGATILSILVPLPNGTKREVLIGPKNPEDYHLQECFMGATIGRFANRIDNCTFKADGKDYVIDAGGKPVALHGGKEGFDKRRFTIESKSENSATLSLLSPDGDMGFPGNFKLTVEFKLSDDNRLDMHYKATCDKSCPACITNHSYFNLNGHHSTVLKHEAMFNCDEILPLTESAVPSGELYSVATPKANGERNNFDFRQFKALAKDADTSIFKDDENMVFTNGYDHPYVIRNFGDKTKACATVRGEVVDGAQVELEVYTDYPAFQFYTGNFINVGTKHNAVAKDDGKDYGRYDGFCIEPEFFPDSPHLEKFAAINPYVDSTHPLERFISYKFNVR